MEVASKGTLFFMAFEVESQRYIYNEITAAVQHQGAIEWSDDEDEVEAMRADILGLSKPIKPATRAPEGTANKNSKATIPFKHNPLNDLESVVWVVLWLFVCSEFVDTPNVEIPDAVWTQTLQYHADLAKQLFRDKTFRQDAMATDGVLLAGLRAALPQLQGPAQALDTLRAALVGQFAAVQKQRKLTGEQVSFDDMIDCGIHKAMTKSLRKVGHTLVVTNQNLTRNVSSWSQQRQEKPQDTVSNVAESDAPAVGTRRTFDHIQEDPVASNKRVKSHRDQSASSARAVSPPGSDRGTEPQTHRLQ